MLYTVWVYEKVNYIKEKMYKKKVWTNLSNLVIESQTLPILILQHIPKDILRITWTSTHLKNIFSGQEGDLPVGFPDRFNSS